MHVSLESGIRVAEQFLQELFKKYGKYPSPLMAGMVPATMWILSYIIMRIRIMKRASQRESSTLSNTEQESLMTIFHVRNNYKLENVKNRHDYIR
jgi:hypothetical protein